MIEASKMLVQASTTEGPLFCRQDDSDPSGVPLGLLVLLLDLASRLQCREATLAADARSTYHQHSQRLIYALIIN